MKKAENILLTLLIIIEPFLDTYFMYNYPTLELFGFRISTIIRYGLLAAIFILLLINTKLKNHRKSIIVYFIILVLYIGLHHYAAIHFKSLIPGNFGYNLMEEIFYICRFMFPLVIIYYMYCEEVNSKWFKNILVAFCLIVSVSTIVSNIFLISKSSYYEYNISYNFFDWFVKDISFANASTRGFFYATIVMTNLLLITPYIYYLYYKEGKYIYLTTIICNMLALFMAGTKACTLGFIIVAVCMLILYLFFTLIKKEIKLNGGHLLVSIVILAMCFGILPKTPAMQRAILTNGMFADSNIPEIDVDKKDDSELGKDDDEENTITNESELEKIDISKYKDFKEIYSINNKKEREGAIKKYIYVNLADLGITSKFITTSYSYLYDSNFWADTILYTSEKDKADNRYIEMSIFNRIKKINNTYLDDLFGITYSRTSKIFNLERDFLYQYYSLGIIGAFIFLGPIVGILLACMIKMLLKHKEYLTLENTSLCLGVGLLLCIAAYSGNIMDNLGITIILGFVAGYLVNKCFKSN